MIPKLRRQRIWSATSGIRHRMVYDYGTKYCIHFNNQFLEVVHIDQDLWKIKQKGDE